MRVPVIAYMVVILAMSFACLLRLWLVRGPAFWLPFLGSLCFLSSYSLLAFQRFRGKIRSGDTLVAVTYVGAQVLITLGFLIGEGLRRS